MTVRIIPAFILKLISDVGGECSIQRRQDPKDSRPETEFGRHASTSKTVQQQTQRRLGLRRQVLRIRGSHG